MNSMIIKLTLVALTTPLYAAYGLWCLLLGLVGLRRQLAETQRLLGETLSCPSCGHDNPLDGRWSCAACGGTYHGFVGECTLCSAGASFFPCEECGISIRLRSVR